ncbi:site-specific integrase [Pelagibius sp. Alg239-R121]|uniref:tyrosine-type recombinase/integrase n=1 Tax=Pelagibius sp. Alg239-R121 TaxID=2993448 RepID=UPI0024A75C33|nr:site-specific integrase [Pelagibius sp. Alg239-R121]
MATKLTKTLIDGTAYQGGTHIVFDTEVRGLGVRVYAGGEKAFVLSYRFKGKKKRITLATYGTLTLTEARKLARRKLAQIADGIDPAEQRAQERTQGTLKKLAEAYFAEKTEQGTKTVAKMRWRFDRHTPKTWLGRVAAEISRSEVNGLRSKIGRLGPYEANRYVQILRPMFNRGLSGSYDDVDIGLWFFERGSENPAAEIEMFKERKRKRFMRESELPNLAKQIDQCPNVYVRGAIWLFLLTGCRKSEILGLRRAKHETEPYVDLTHEQIVIPDPKSTGDDEQTVPLTGPAIAVIQALPIEEDNPFLLPGRRKGRPLVNIDKHWAAIRKDAGCEDLHIHDLRRTVGSWMTAAGEDLNVIRHGLRHASLSTTLIYARLGAEPARKALDDHSRKVMEIAGKARASGDE